MTFTLPQLPYAYNALEPFIDEQTMTIHHTKHHQTYIDKLNQALEKYPDLQQKSIEELLTTIDSLPEDIRTQIKNHGGGHSNHSLFWEILSTEKLEPSQNLLQKIIDRFESIDKFKYEFTQAALNRFGSGWSWLVIESGKLEIISTANQDSPYMSSQTPILGLDVWEHAYYLKYQNRRPEYVQAFWNIVNWNKVEENLQKAVK